MNQLHLTSPRKSSTFENIMIGIAKLIAYALLAYGIYLVVKFFSNLNKGSRPVPPRNKPSGLMVKDDICNTYLPRENAIKEIQEGKEYYFCSETCRQKYLQEKS